MGRVSLRAAGPAGFGGPAHDPGRGDPGAAVAGAVFGFWLLFTPPLVGESKNRENAQTFSRARDGGASGCCGGVRMQSVRWILGREDGPLSDCVRALGSEEPVMIPLGLLVG